MKVVRTMLTAGLALAVLAAAGCGGDSRRASQQNVRETGQPAATSPGSTAPIVPARVTDPVRRAYIARVDGVCKRLDPERNGARENVSAGDEAQVLKGYDDSISVGASQLRQIEAIKPPPGDAATLRANVFDVIGRQLAIRRQIRTALANGDNAQVQSL